MKKPIIKAPVSAPPLPSRPGPAVQSAARAAFVAGDGKTPVKRLTIDLPPEVHTAFKARAASEGTAMVDLVRAWIDDYLAGSARR